MAQSKPKSLSAKWFWLIWLTSFALVVGSVFVIKNIGVFGGARPTAFRQTAHGWEALPPISSVGYDLRISGGGVVWLQTANGLMRLEGSTWHRFKASDFGTEYDYLPGQFTLDGEDVWAAASDAVIHFDGQRWQRYTNALESRTPTSIAVSHGKVWVIDRDGNLSHFDGHAWAVRKLDLPGVRWDSWMHVPKLAVLGNGAPWLVYQGLWRLDGSAWAHVSGVGSEAQLLGTTSPGSYVLHGKKIETRGEIWVADRDEAVGFDTGGSLFVRYKLHDLGLEDSARIYAVAGAAPSVAFGTSQGLVWFDGNGWHGEQPSALGVYMASSVAVAPDGTLWGIGYPPSRTNYSRLRTILIANLVLCVFTLVFPIWWWSRKQRRQRQLTEEAVLHATGALPEDADETPPWKTVGGFVLVLALGGAGYGALKHYWPATPTWALPLFLLGAHVTSAVIGSLKKRKPKPSDPIGPGGPPRYDWAKSLPAILGSLAMVVLLYGSSIARHFHIRWLTAIPGFALLVGGSFVLGGWDLFRGHRVESEIKRCQYGKALVMLDGPLGWPPTGIHKLLQADALFYGGRAREAEAIVRELVETKNDANHKTLAFEHLGRNLMAQSRYEDARRAFEAAIQLLPARSAAYTGLAELRLVQDQEPVQALDYAQRALELHRNSLLERKAAKERLAIIRGNQAWALARMGRAAEAQQAIEAGTREMDLKYTPEVAGFYWRAGMAMVAVENLTAAAAHFRRGAELDPQGYYGKLAAAHLSRHSVWGAVGIA